MRFILHHLILTQLSVGIGIAFFYVLNFAANRPVLNGWANRTVELASPIAGYLAMATFLIWGYLTTSIFYFPDNIGVVGDMYCYMCAIMSWKNTVINFHMAFPWIGEKFLSLCQAIGFLSPTDPSYYEKAVQLAAWPTKTLMVSGLCAAFLHFYKSTSSFSKAFLAFFMLATSYGCWIWGLEANALGMGVALQMIIFATALYWIEKRSLWFIALLAVLTSACVFVHVAFWGFCVGMVLAPMLLIFWSSGSIGRRIVEAAVFNLAVAATACVFLSLEFQINKASNLSQLFGSLTNGDPFLEQKRTVGNLALTLKDNLVTGVMNITNLWDPQNLWEKGLIALQLGSAIGLIISLIVFFKATVRHVNKPQLLVYTVTSLSVLIAFMFTYPGTHYYVVATIPNLFLFLTLVLTDVEKPQEMVKRKWLMILFIMAGFTYNGFFSRSVFRGRNINENEYYRISEVVLNHLGPSSNAHIFKKLDFADYINASVRAYYHSKFANITWDADEKYWGNPAEFVAQLKSLHAPNRQIYVDASAITLLRRSPVQFHLSPVTDNLWKINVEP